MILDRTRIAAIPRLLQRRVRLAKGYSVKLWFILLCLLVGLIIKISRSNDRPNTTSTIIDLNLDESLLTREALAKVPIPQRRIDSETDKVFHEGCVDITNVDSSTKANAALVVLSRNKELDGVIKSMKSLEYHFNQWFNYPWVFLNDEEHSDHFKETVLKYTKAKVSFGTIPSEQWDFSEKNNLFDEHIMNQGDRGIMYGQLESYHKMCRFYSKYFFKHDLVKNLEWYWRVEPDVEFYCDLTYDPFLEMERSGKKYGFTVMIKELLDTVPNLFRYTKTFAKNLDLNYGDSWKLFIKDLNFFDGEDKHRYSGIDNVPELIHKIEDEIKIAKLLESEDDNSIDEAFLETLVDKSSELGLPRILEDQFEMEEYNLCHFWSNFEIARTDLFNNELYDQYIQFLEESGGFYKERWGDAPIHSLAVGLFTNLTDVHYFRDIGYKHSTLGHCPSNSPENQLPYVPGVNSPFIKPQKYDSPKKNGVGCRCKCPSNFIEIENSGGSCMGQWINLTKNPPLRSKLDIDKIKSKIKEKFDAHLNFGGDLKEWKLTEKDIKELTKERVA